VISSPVSFPAPPKAIRKRARQSISDQRYADDAPKFYTLAEAAAIFRVSKRVLQAPAASTASQALAPGSARADPPTFQTAGNQAVTAISECRAKRLSGELKSFTASAQCSGPRIIEAFSKANYRYMDLVTLMVAKRAQISERLDRNEMSETDANVAFQQAFTDVVTVEEKRDAARRQ
jgi:hypothetical protein